MKAITKKILVASVTIGVLTPFSGGGGGVVSAEETSNQEVIVNDGNYSINGTNYTYTGNLNTLFRAGGTWGSEDSNNNTFTFYGGTVLQDNLWAGYSSNGNVSGNTFKSLWWKLSNYRRIFWCKRSI